MGSGVIDWSAWLLAQPAMVFVAGALALAFIADNRVRVTITLVVPLISGAMIWSAPAGDHETATLFGFDLVMMRVDKLAVVFGLIFSLAAFLAALYAWHVRDRVQQVATLIYAGSAIGAVFAGDLITLFFYWEGTALASVFLIWARGTEGAYHTGMRYLIVQIGSGVLLFAGAATHYAATGSIAFVSLTGDGPASWGAGPWLILLALGIKCAFPLFHNWLQDSYPAATVTGTVTLSAFSTKMAVYCLARAFPGTEMLIYVGAIMTLFPIFFAEIENDLRRVLSYSLNNQLGFMVVGVGIGTELSLNGTAAHAFCHILYKALLFMSVGAVLYRTGTSKASELGGLYRTMPWTALLCIVGAASISAFPLFSGFVSKSLIMSAAGKEQYFIVWLALVFASAGVLSHSGIKIPYFTFFAHDSGKRPAEAPWNMMAAMGITAFLCVFIGVFPGTLYALLPYAVSYEPYTTAHVLEQFQLLLFAMFAFALLMRGGLYPEEKRGINLDSDWVYRRALPRITLAVRSAIEQVGGAIDAGAGRLLSRAAQKLYRTHGPAGVLGRQWPTGNMALWTTVILGGCLISYFVAG
ncbi:MAG: Na(+)/H(+) antiporter subunit D [Pseudomonadota bacterium]